MRRRNCWQPEVGVFKYFRILPALLRFHELLQQQLGHHQTRKCSKTEFQEDLIVLLMKKKTILELI